MPHHEEKICPRCQARFECKVGSINLCQCQTVQLNDDERAYIQAQFDDCFCANCLLALKKEYNQRKFEGKFNRVYALYNLKSPLKKS
jgi:hypothetical protein